MFEHAIAAPAPEIAGAISTNGAIQRISPEDFFRELRIIPIALREKSAANSNFADLARCGKRARFISYVDFDPIDRLANRNDPCIGKTRRAEDLGCDTSSFRRRIAIADAPVTLEMSG